MADSSDALADALRAAPPAGVAALPDDVQARLAEQVRAAQRHQSTVVEESVQAAVKGVPLPVRGIIGKALL